MTILIADDEKLARYALKSMLKEIGIPSSSIQVACDGREMVEKVASFHPDLALVDIRMPRLDGLEAIQKGRAHSPHTKWIILTSYSMFEYAKKAVALGASAYLLKPVSPQELSRAVRQITRASRGSYQRLNEEFEAHLTALLHHTASLEHEKLDFPSEAVLWGSLLVIDSRLKKSELLIQEHKVCDLIRNKQSAVIDQTTRIALCRLSEGQLALIAAWRSGRGGLESSETIRDHFRKLPVSLNSAMRRAVCCSLLEGGRFANFRQLHENLHLLAELAPLRVIAGVGASIGWDTIRTLQANRSEIELAGHLAALPEAAREEICLDFLKHADAVAEIWKAVEAGRRTEIYDPILRFLEVSLDFRPSRSTSMEEWSEKLREHGKELCLSAAGAEGRDIVGQVLQFLDDNYMNDIGVAQIAGQLDLTPNYLSHLFREKTGTNFLTYLRRLRMDRARELLADPSRRVAQVAREVGYGSSRHFSALFKLAEGLSPSEFRRRMRGGGGKQ
jgi:two-component system response regulator YesN